MSGKKVENKKIVAPHIHITKVPYDEPHKIWHYVKQAAGTAPTSKLNYLRYLRQNGPDGNMQEKERLSFSATQKRKAKKGSDLKSRLLQLDISTG